MLTLLLGANLTWTTLALGGLRAETRVVTWGLTSLLLLAHLLERALARGPVSPLHPAGWAMVPFLVYAALNVMFVSPVPWLGWLDWLGWMNVAVTFWVALNAIRSGPTRRALWFVLVALGLIAVTLGGYQRFVQPEWLMFERQQAAQFVGRASGCFGIPNSLAGFLILLLPATGALACKGTAAARVWWGWVTAVLSVGLVLSVSRGAWLSLALALVAWPLVASRRAWRRRIAAAGAALVGLTLVAAIVYWVSPQARMRWDRLVTDSGELSRPILWRAAWQLWRAEPAVGTGAGSFNVRFEAHRPAGFVDEPQWVHSEYLNTLSDYGLIGFSLALGAAAWIAVRHRRGRTARRATVPGRAIGSPVVAAAFGVGCVAFALQMAVDFHLKIPALGMALAVVAALALGPPPDSGRTAGAPVTGRGRWSGWAALLGMSVTLLPGARWLQAEALRHGARERLEQELRGPGDPRAALLHRAEADLRRAVSLWPSHGGAWSDLAHVLQFQAYVEPAKSWELSAPAEAAARRALAISAVVPEFWLRLGIALDMQRRRVDALSAYEYALRLAPHSATAWYYYADHLSRDTETREGALRAIATCLSLDPGNAAAEALRAKLSPLP